MSAASQQQLLLLVFLVCGLVPVARPIIPVEEEIQNASFVYRKKPDTADVIKCSETMDCSMQKEFCAAFYMGNNFYVTGAHCLVAKDGIIHEPDSLDILGAGLVNVTFHVHKEYSHPTGVDIAWILLDGSNLSSHILVVAELKPEKCIRFNLEVFDTSPADIHSGFRWIRQNKTPHPKAASIEPISKGVLAFEYRKYVDRTGGITEHVIMCSTKDRPNDFELHFIAHGTLEKMSFDIDCHRVGCGVITPENMKDLPPITMESSEVAPSLELTVEPESVEFSSDSVVNTEGPTDAPVAAFSSELITAVWTTPPSLKFHTTERSPMGLNKEAGTDDSEFNEIGSGTMDDYESDWEKKSTENIFDGILKSKEIEELNVSRESSYRNVFSEVNTDVETTRPYLNSSDSKTQSKMNPEREFSTKIDGTTTHRAPWLGRDSDVGYYSKSIDPNVPLQSAYGRSNKVGIDQPSNSSNKRDRTVHPNETSYDSLGSVSKPQHESQMVDQERISDSLIEVPSEQSLIKLDPSDPNSKTDIERTRTSTEDDQEETFDYWSDDAIPDDLLQEFQTKYPYLSSSLETGHQDHEFNQEKLRKTTKCVIPVTPKPGSLRLWFSSKWNIEAKPNSANTKLQSRTVIEPTMSTPPKTNPTTRRKRIQMLPAIHPRSSGMPEVIPERQVLLPLVILGCVILMMLF